MRLPKTSRRSRLSRRESILLGLLLTSVLLVGGWKIYRTHTVTQWTEAYLPSIEKQAQSKSHDGDTDFLFILATRQVQAQNFAGATNTLKKLVTLGKNDPLLWRTWAACAVLSGDAKTGAAILKMGENNPIAGKEVKEALGRCQNIPADALPSDVALAICPEGPDAFVKTYLPQASLAFLPSSGFATCEKQAKENPNDIPTQVRWARALQKNQRLGEAQLVLQSVLQKDGKNYDAKLLLADIYSALKTYAKAGNLYQAILKEKPDDPAAVLGVAHCAVEVKLIYKAMENAQKAVKLLPQSAEAWATLGRAYFNQKMRWDKAVESFDKAQALDANYLDYCGPYYDALRLVGRTGDAEKMIRQRLEQKPDDAFAHYLLATALLDKPQTLEIEKQAEQELQRAVTLAPNAVMAQARLGEFLLGKDKPKEALPHLRTALSDDRYNGKVATLLARALKRVGETEEAAIAEENAQKLNIYLKERQGVEDNLSREPTNLALRKKLLDILQRGGEEDKANREQETITILEKYPEQAKKGLTALLEAQTITGSSRP
jgi:tetratricopeptide (TPR) repeat protein